MPESSPDNTPSDNSSGFSVATLLQQIFSDAVARKVSEIRLVPSVDAFLVQYVIDEKLVFARQLPKRISDSVIGRIKSMTRLDVAERHVAQSGRLTLLRDTGDVTMSVDTRPSPHGEQIVMRLTTGEH